MFGPELLSVAGLGPPNFVSSAWLEAKMTSSGASQLVLTGPRTGWPDKRLSGQRRLFQTPRQHKYRNGRYRIV